jgi:hypothetical protein
MGEKKEQNPRQFLEIFLKNPLAWVLGIALAWALYANNSINDDLTQICDLTGPHDIEMNHPATAREIIDNICVRRRGADDYAPNN